MCIFVINSVAIVITCITFLCISLSWQFFIKYNVCLGEMLLLLYCRGTHLSPSELSFSLHAQKISPSMENMCCLLEWRHLCCVQGNKCPLFSPIRMIRLSLDVLRKNKPLALLSDVLPYGKCKPQEIVMALHHFRQGLAPARFSKPC